MPKIYDAGADASLTHAKKSAADFRKLMRNQHDHGSEIRMAVHGGHKIEIKTTYQVKVDGKVLKIRFSPDQDGSISYHAVPNVSFASAVDLIRYLIDAFPDEFGQSKKKTGKKQPTGDGHDHADHGAARPAVKRAGR